MQVLDVGSFIQEINAYGQLKPQFRLIEFTRVRISCEYTTWRLINFSFCFEDEVIYDNVAPALNIIFILFHMGQRAKISGA